MEILSFFHGDVGLPSLLPVQRIHTDTPGDKRPRAVCDPFQRTLDTIKNVVDDTRSQRHRYRAAAGHHFFSGAQARGLLIDLHCGQIFVKGNDLAHQMLTSYIDHFAHAKPGISFQINDGAVNPVNRSGLTHHRHLLKT